MKGKGTLKRQSGNGHMLVNFALVPKLIRLRYVRKNASRQWIGNFCTTLDTDIEATVDIVGLLKKTLSRWNLSLRISIKSIRRP